MNTLGGTGVIPNAAISTLLYGTKYKEAAESYAARGKYDSNIVNNTEYIYALSKYAEAELVKKAYINGADLSDYYSVGDIDNDGILEVVVYEKNISMSLGIFTPNNIKLFKYTNDKYSLLNTVKNNADYCISINISKAKDDINGVFVSGGVGAHSGSQCLYIIKDGKLAPALDEDVFSIYPYGIKDIDGDKILELSTLERDPRDPDTSNASCSKILTWYKWDGEKGLITVRIDETK